MSVKCILTGQTPDINDIGAQPKITTDGILKGDGNGNIDLAVNVVQYETLQEVEAIGNTGWELINTITVAEADAARVIKIDKDNSGNAFSLKEFAFSANTNSTKTDASVYGWFCVNGRGTYNSGTGGFQTNYVRHPSTGAAIYNDVIGRVIPCGLIIDTSTQSRGTGGVAARTISDIHEVEFAGYGYDDNKLYGTFSLWGIRK